MFLYGSLNHKRAQSFLHHLMTCDFKQVEVGIHLLQPCNGLRFYGFILFFTLLSLCVFTSWIGVFFFSSSSCSHSLTYSFQFIVRMHKCHRRLNCLFGILLQSCVLIIMKPINKSSFLIFSQFILFFVSFRKYKIYKYPWPMFYIH